MQASPLLRGTWRPYQPHGSSQRAPIQAPARALHRGLHRLPAVVWGRKGLLARASPQSATLSATETSPTAWAQRTSTSTTSDSTNDVQLADASLQHGVVSWRVPPSSALQQQLVASRAGGLLRSHPVPSPEEDAAGAATASSSSALPAAAPSSAQARSSGQASTSALVHAVGPTLLLPARRRLVSLVAARELDRGSKIVMEDAFNIRECWEALGQDASFLGVYDGHGGAGAARTARRQLPMVLGPSLARVVSLMEDAGLDSRNWQDDSALMIHATGGSELASAVTDAFLEVDRRILEVNTMMADSYDDDDPYVEARDGSGSTAVVAVRKGNKLTVANVGDSRAVLVRAGKAVRMTVDHLPDDAGEASRIISAGGEIRQLPNSTISRVFPPSGNMYPPRGLAVSRSFGDQHHKLVGVISVPHLATTLLTPEDDMLIVASDGLWMVFPDEQDVADEAIKLRAELQLTLGGDLKAIAHAIAARLVSMALRKGGRDNITVVVALPRWEGGDC